MTETVDGRTVVSEEAVPNTGTPARDTRALRPMTFGVSAGTARRLRMIGAALVLLVLVTAPFERWYLVRRANAMQERILDLRRAASARFPEGWQRDLAAVDEVADLEYRRAQVRHRIVTQLTLEGWTLRLLLVGGVLFLVGTVMRLRQSADGS